MDARKGIKNITTSLAFKVLILIANIFVRRMIIKYVGNEINGLNSLFTSIIGILAIAELGAGVAISFCMYKPIVEGDTDKVAELYRIFKRLYIVIGGIVVLGGCIVMPFLPYLAKGYQNYGLNLYLYFGMTLISVFISYVFSAKTSLINAFKNDYITTIISSCGLLIQYGLQITVLIVFKSYVAFLLCQIFAVVLQFVVTEIIAFKKYPEIVKSKIKIDKKTRQEVTKNIKAMFAHKVGNALVNGADSLIISTFIGVAMLGFYSNYTTIMISMTGVLGLFFTSLTSVVGHAIVSENKDSTQRHFWFFHTFNFILGVIFFLGYYAVVDNLVTLLFGANLEVDKSISFVIAVNYFIQFMRQTTMLFRDASGTFYYDRWRPIIEGVVNIILSIALSFILGVVGVIVATIITNLFIAHIIEPYVLFKHKLEMPVKKYYLINYVYILIFVGLLIAMHFTLISNDNQWIELFANGGISLAFSLVISTLVIFLNKNFRNYMKSFFQKLSHRIKRSNNKVIESDVSNIPSDTDEPNITSESEEPDMSSEADNNNY